MRVTHLRLWNWRNFRLVDVPMRSRVFIVGPNASGKSNLLDVFRFLRDLAKGQGGGLQTAVTERGGVPKLRCLAARANPTIRIEVEIAEDATGSKVWKYVLGISQETRGYRRPIVQSEEVWRDGRRELCRPNVDDRQDAERLTETHLEQTTANGDFREVAAFLGSTHYLHLVPQLLRNPWAFTGQSMPGDPYGRSFLERLAKTSEKTRDSRLRRIEKALRAAVPQLGRLKFVKDEVGRPHLEAMYEHWRPNAGRQQEDQFSDGTLRLIGLLWSLMDTNSLLLLEEPELSLNSEVVRLIPQVMHRTLARARRQVLVSTHSFEILSDKGISGEETLLITPGREGSEVRVAASIRAVRDLLERGMSVAEAALPHAAPAEVRQLSLFDV